MTKLKEVITPVAACALFGRSAEAVRRAVAEGFVKSSYALNIGARPIRLLDLDKRIKVLASKVASVAETNRTGYR